ncbi:MarR family transcriptional regulator [Epidermidibacterium keratini]|uniref:MarR family transcriptional regulator n=1 Tax=Epidermidibacterium keratini TaxID=1891644 RepID=A0A7L4YN37_9ACTN|nr:MarR family transcriptional regulator [Epidermidibacterium keratini]QHC00264.1 MarR family transcriptional regulator [Epidermidibacterium keratini]
MTRAKSRRNERAVAEFIESFAVMLTDAGMPRMPSRVFALMLTRDESSITAAEIASELHVSPAAVSGAVRYLIATGQVAKVRVRGERADRYSLGDTPWYEALVSRNPLMGGMTSHLERGVAAVGADTPAGERMARTHDFFDFLGRRMPDLLEEWRTGRGD